MSARGAAPSLPMLTCHTRGMAKGKGKDKDKKGGKGKGKAGADTRPPFSST
jgi:hypothetical protein